MSSQESENHCRQDFITGVLAVGLGWWYRTEASKIENSLLSDEVGAGGVPGAVGTLVVIVGVILVLKGLYKWFKTKNALEKIQVDWVAHGLATSLAGLLYAYAFLLPLMGYVVAIIALIASATYLGSARKIKSIVLYSLIAGPVLWLMFSKLLSVRLPVGTLF